MSDDAELLRRYAEENSEAAFAGLVQQHLGFVYHTALRHLNGNAAGAEDVAQVVFADLARKAAVLARRTMLTGWLHTRARHAAWNYLRAERRRQAREQEAHLMQELTRETEPSADWERLRPVIDDVLQDLNSTDREAVLMRFFEGRGFAEVGARLQLSEDGARSRVSRALDKMQTLLARRGIASTAGAVSLALASHAAAVAPAGLAATVTTSVLSGAVMASAGSAFTLGALSFMKITTVLLTGSLATNAILGAMRIHDTRIPPPTASIASTSPVAPPNRSAADLKALYDPNPATFLARLQAAGLSEPIRRALVEAAIDAQFRAREEALRPKRPTVEWWQWQDDRLPLETGLALLDLRREKEKLRVQLLGPDPASLAQDDADNPIPEAKRAMLKLIGEDYSVMLASLRFPGLTLPAERQQLQLLEEQRTKDLAALLTPAELAAYEERSWTGLSTLRNRLRFVDATEAEFALVKNSAVQSAEILRTTGSLTADDEKTLEDRLRQNLGEARYAALDQSKRPEFHDLQALLERSGRPSTDAAPVYDLAKAAERESHRIGDETDATPAQKAEMLRQLALRTRSGIREKLGPEIGDPYLKRTLWLSWLEQGQVITFTPGGYGGRSVSFPPRPSPIPAKGTP